MKFKQFLETFSIPTDKPITIILTGGIASGKSTTYKYYFTELKIHDIDLLTKGDMTSYKSKGIELQYNVEKDIVDTTSIVYTKTGAVPAKILKNIELAKENNMRTAVIFVDTPIEKALQNNITRAKSGNWHLIPEKDIIETNEKARKNFKMYEKLCDYSQIIKY